MNKTFIKNLVISCGVSGVVTTQHLANILSINARTVNMAKNKGQLRQIDRNTFDIDSIVEWLYTHPRYMTGIKLRRTENEH